MLRASALFAFIGLSSAFGQAPSITTFSVVNSASWSQPVAPGGLVSIFGSNLAGTTASASAPLPFALGGTTVTVNGVPATLLYVSSTQINAQMPKEVPGPSGSVGAVSVVVTTAAGSGGAQVGLAAQSPGLFAMDGSGCGQAAALSSSGPFLETVNGPANSAAPGDYVSLFGTGFGLWSIQPPDGAAATSALQVGGVGLTVDGQPVTPSYAGPAPSLVGVEQINFQIPAGTRNGCAVPVQVSAFLASPRLTVAIQNGRGQCVDPAITSYGQIYLNQSAIYGPGVPATTTFSSMSASFPSGPQLQPPVPPQIVMAPNWSTSATISARLISSQVPFNTLSCAVPGYGDLSAGAIELQGDVPGAAMTVTPQIETGTGTVYAADLPPGFFGPGTYTLSGTAGSAVGLKNAVMTVGAPIQVTSMLTSGTTISESQPFTVTWTGGDANSLVEVSLISGGVAAYTYTPATAGTVTMTPLCSGGQDGLSPKVCSFGIPASTGAQVTVQVLPATPTTVRATGVTGPVTLSWGYSYTFTGLTLGY